MPDLDLSDFPVSSNVKWKGIRASVQFSKGRHILENVFEIRVEKIVKRERQPVEKIATCKI